MEFLRGLIRRTSSKDNADTTVDGSNSRKPRKTVSFESNVIRASSIDGGELVEDVVQIRFANSRKSRSLTAVEEFKPAVPLRQGLQKTKSVFIPATTPSKDRVVLNRKAVSVHGARMFNDDDEANKNSKFVIPAFKPRPAQATPGLESIGESDADSRDSPIPEVKRESPVPEKRISPVPRMEIAEIPAFKPKPKKEEDIEEVKESDILRGEDIFSGIGLSPKKDSVGQSLNSS